MAPSNLWATMDLPEPSVEVELEPKIIELQTHYHSEKWRGLKPLH